MSHREHKTGKLIYFVVFGMLLLTFIVGCGDDDVIPTAPKELGHITTKGNVSLYWQEAEYAETYRIYRGSQVDGSFPVIGVSNGPAYDDTQVAPDSIYYYKVAGISSDGFAGMFSAPYEVFYREGKLQVERNLIDFGDSLVLADLKLKNIGGLTLHWTLSTRDSWISVEPEEGDLNPEEERVVRITINREGEPREYTGAVLVKTDTGQGDVQITVKMQIPDEPRIGVDPTELSFDETGQAHTLTIQNTGTGILVWEIQNIPDWLALDDVEGQTSMLSPSRIQLTIADSEELQTGKTYTATLGVLSNDIRNPEITVSISLYVPPLPPKPSISDTDKHLVFSPKESSRSITVHNIGEGIMTWSVQVESSASWLRVDPQSGETDPGGSDPLTFTVDREQGVPGKTLKTTVTIDVGIAGSEDIIIEVPIPEESWVVSPESLTLNNGASKDILIRNTGEEKLYWSVSSHEFWLIPGDKNGEIEPGKIYSLSVSADHAELTLGSHIGQIQIETRGGKQLSVRIQTIKKGYITGMALDSRSSIHVRDILISLDGKSPKNYPSGDFRIECAIPGAFHLKAEREEYLPAIFNGTLDDRGNTDLMEMWMRPVPHVVDTIADPVRPFGAPVDICFSGDGTRAYVSDELGSVSIVDVLTDTMIDQIAIGINPMGVIAHPHNDEVYIADAEAHQVSIFDARSREVVGRVEVDKYPQQLAISQDGNQLYVTCRDSGSVVLVDTELRQVERRLFVGREPYGVALSPDGRTLYVANSGGNSVSIMDASTGRSLEVISVASHPQHLAVSKDYVYISNSFGDRVSVIHQATQKLVEHIEVGNAILLGDLVLIEESMGGDVVYVIDRTNSVLRLIDSVTLEVIDDSIPVGDMPTAVAISPDLRKIYVVNGGSANISVLEFQE